MPRQTKMISEIQIKTNWCILDMTFAKEHTFFLLHSYTSMNSSFIEISSNYLHLAISFIICCDPTDSLNSTRSGPMQQIMKMEVWLSFLTYSSCPGITLLLRKCDTCSPQFHHNYSNHFWCYIEWNARGGQGGKNSNDCDN